MNQLVIKPAFGNVFLQRIQRFLRFGGVFPIVNPWFHEKSPFSGEAPNWTRSSAAYLPQHSNCMDDSNRRAGALKKKTKISATNLAALSSAAGAVLAHGFVNQRIQFATREGYVIARV